MYALWMIMLMSAAAADTCKCLCCTCPTQPCNCVPTHKFNIPLAVCGAPGFTTCTVTRCYQTNMYVCMPEGSNYGNTEVECLDDPTPSSTAGDTSSANDDNPVYLFPVLITAELFLWMNL